jgi:hypothetical protein
MAQAALLAERGGITTRRRDLQAVLHRFPHSAPVQKHLALPYQRTCEKRDEAYDLVFEARESLSRVRSREQAAEPLGAGRLTGFLAFALLLALCFGQPLLSLAKCAVNTDLHSHILLVPFASACLLFIQRRKLMKEYLSSPGWGVDSSIRRPHGAIRGVEAVG